MVVGWRACGRARQVGCSLSCMVYPLSTTFFLEFPRSRSLSGPKDGVVRRKKHSAWDIRSTEDAPAGRRLFGRLLLVKSSEQRM